jgi:RND family efflux transporter MFP subunit
MNTRKLFGTLWALGVMLGAAACHTANKEADSPATVKTDTVRTAGELTQLQLPGKVEAAHDVDLAFRVSGTIQRIYVQDGQHVAAGQLLAALDPTDYQVQLNATEAEYTQVKADAERVMALYADGGTTPQMNDKAVYGLKQITAKYQHHKDQLAYTKLYAPFAGSVQKHLFEAHETVGAGMPVISMVSAGTPEVEINLPAAEYIRRDRFTDYSCTFDIYPGNTYPLRLVSITPKANANQLYTMRLQLEKTSLPLPSPGMNTMVSIACAEQDSPQLTVATGALLRDADRTFVYIYNKVKDDQSRGTLKRQEVRVARLLSDGRALVECEALKPGTVIVGSGVHTLADGQTVNALPPVSKTNVGGMM